MRVKEIQVAHDVSSRRYTLTNSSGVITTDQVFENEVADVTDMVITDVVVPNFHKRQKQGEIFNNPYTRQTTSEIHTSGNDIAQFTTAPASVNKHSGVGITRMRASTLVGVIQPIKYPSKIDIESAIADIQQAALAKIDKTPYAFMEDVFEIRATARTLRHPVQEMLEVLKKFRLKRASFMDKGQDFASASANAWLYARFALRPIFISVENAIEYHDKRSKKPPSRRTSRARGPRIENTESGVAILGGSSYRTFNYYNTTFLEPSAGVLYNDTQNEYTFRDDLGLRVKDMPITLYAILPYSWAVDRFLKMSDTIKALTNLADPSINILAPWSKFRFFESKLLQMFGGVSPGWTVTDANGGVWLRRKEIIARQPFAPWKSIHLTKQVPNFKEIANTADLLALGYKMLTATHGNKNSIKQAARNWDKLVDQN